MDKYVPAFIRNSYWFMYPFYFVAYRGKNIKQVMNFKSLVHTFSDEDNTKFYSELNSISRNRKTDLTEKQILTILKSIDKEDKNILDIGCGNGHLLKRIKKEHPHTRAAGMDIVDVMQEDIQFYQGSITAIPFKNDEFDVVICTHTLEHILDLPSAIRELERVTRKKLIVVTPCQHYFYYTLDEHVNFFPKEEVLTSLFSFSKFSCKKINFDWVYTGFKNLSWEKPPADKCRIQ